MSVGGECRVEVRVGIGTICGYEGNTFPILEVLMFPIAEEGVTAVVETSGLFLNVKY